MGVGYWKGLHIFMALDLHWHIAFLKGLIGFSMPVAKSVSTCLTTALHSTGSEFVGLPKYKMAICYCTLNASAHS